MGQTLPPKYEQALALIEQDDLTYREIAKQCGIGETTLYEFIEGKSESTQIGKEFTRRLEEIGKKRDKEIRELLKSNKKETHLLINKYLKNVKQRKTLPKKTVELLVSVANALAKSTPKVEIGSFSYTQGLNAQELIYEFERLKGTGGGIGRGQDTVSLLGQREAGEIPVPKGSGEPIDPESEDTSLQTESEA